VLQYVLQSVLLTLLCVALKDNELCVAVGVAVGVAVRVAVCIALCIAVCVAVCVVVLAAECVVDSLM